MIGTIAATTESIQEYQQVNSKGNKIDKLSYQGNSIEIVVEEQIHETQIHKYVDQDDDDNNNHNCYSIYTHTRDVTEAMNQSQSKNSLWREPVTRTRVYKK